ncbi:MAG: hypothetical protein AMXMBFR53_30000 [Gemmatimonadota bacterium]
MSPRAASRYPLLIYAMHGLGDSIYQRAMVRWHAERRGEVFLHTSWPEFFEDIPGLRFIRPGLEVDLRAQRKNIERRPEETWSKEPANAQRIRARYALTNPGESIVEELMRSYGIPGSARLPMDLPDFGPSPVRFKRYAVVRPVTHRKEWLNTARSPDPRHIARAAELLQDAGYRVVTVADVEPVKNQEWIEGPEPVADRRFHGGELEVAQLMALLQNASVVVGGVGFVVPAVLAAHVPAVIVAGGQGAYNAPEIVCGPRVDSRHVRWVLPDAYCRCRHRLHACPKRVTDFDAKFAAALAQATGAEVVAA